MEDTLEQIEGAYTYTYDQFTVFFYGDHVYIGGREFPIGQCCVHVLNLDDAILGEINQRVKELVQPYGLCLQKKQTALRLSHRRD